MWSAHSTRCPRCLEWSMRCDRHTCRRVWRVWDVNEGEYTEQVVFADTAAEAAAQYVELFCGPEDAHTYTIAVGSRRFEVTATLRIETHAAEISPLTLVDGPTPPEAA